MKNLRGSKFRRITVSALVKASAFVVKAKPIEIWTLIFCPSLRMYSPKSHSMASRFCSTFVLERNRKLHNTDE